MLARKKYSSVGNIWRIVAALVNIVAFWKSVKMIASAGGAVYTETENVVDKLVFAVKIR